MQDARRIVIIGGSAAGTAAAEAMVEGGLDGRTVLLISDERRAPYKRTKVSKSFAAGFADDDFALHERGWYEAHGVELRVGCEVTAIDLEARMLQLADGERCGWDRLILATGAEPRRLPLPADVRRRLHYAHDKEQVEALRADAAAAEHALVVGSGVLGIEVAEQLVRMGLSVTIVGEEPGLMSGELDGPASAILATTMADHGVALRLEDTVEAIADDGGGRLAVAFAASSARSFDLVVCCIGTRIRSELARDAGLTVGRGVVVDEQLRTSHPNVLAAGDVAEHAAEGGRVTHLWRHALHQGRLAGTNALGGAERYRFVPFRLKCKIFDRYFFSLGRPEPGELARYQLVEQRQGERYRCCYYREGLLAGLVMCNDEAHHKLYSTAVIEAWPRRRVEQIGGW